MPQKYYIIPVNDEPSIPGQPPGIWGPNDPRPNPPIANVPGVPGYRPPGDGIWGPNDPRPTPPIVIPPDSIAPGVPTHPIYIPVYPAHPIVIPPESIGPGVPAHPIVLPPYLPTHPIVIPPDAIEPGVPAHPIYIPPGTWGGAGEPFPTPPIVIPPNAPTKPTDEPVLGAIKPDVNLPGAGTQWVLVLVPGYGARWVGLDVQSAGTGPKKVV